MHEVYNSASEIVAATASAVSSTIPGTQLSYLGYEGISANYTLDLVGIVQGSEMDDLQKGYFSNVTTDFLNDFVQSDFANIFVTTVSQEELQQGIRRLNDPRFDRELQQGDDDGTIKITGTVYGAQASSLDSENFKFSINNAFLTGGEKYANLLRTAGMKPHSLSHQDENPGDFFLNTTAVNGVVTSVAQKSHPENDDDAGDNVGPWDILRSPMIIVIIGSILAAIFLIFLIVQIVKTIRANKEKRDMREKRRRESSQNEGRVQNKKQGEQTPSAPEYPSKARPLKRNVSVDQMTAQSMESGDSSDTSLDGAPHENKGKPPTLSTFMDNQKSKAKPKFSASVGDVPLKPSCAKVKAVKEAEDAPLRHPGGIHALRKNDKSPTGRISKKKESPSKPTVSPLMERDRSKTKPNTSCEEKSDHCGSRASPKQHADTMHNRKLRDNPSGSKPEQNIAKTTAANKPSLSDFIEKHPRKKENPTSGAKTVEYPPTRPQPSTIARKIKEAEDAPTRNHAGSTSMKPMKSTPKPSLIDYMNKNPSSKK